MSEQPAISVRDLTMAYGDYVVMNDLNFSIETGKIQVIMGGSGCGKSTLLKHLIGLRVADKGEVFYGNQQFLPNDPSSADIRRRFGVSFQSGALWSSMTLEENVSLPLQLYTDLSAADIREIVYLKLSMVGLSDFGDRLPSELSGGMQKRAGLARAIALDPDILLFDEPSAGLDPLSSRRLDELLLEIRDAMGTTIVVVTHELASIFTIADKALFLDADSKTALENGHPEKLREDNDVDPKVRNFLNRGES